MQLSLQDFGTGVLRQLARSAGDVRKPQRSLPARHVRPLGLAGGL